MERSQKDWNEDWKSQKTRDYTIVKIDLNTKKGRGDQWKLAVTQPPVICHQLALV